VFISCEDKEDYITIDDVLLEEGFVKGSITGISQDSVKIDESLDLYYSYFGDNTINIENDSNLTFSIETYSNILEQMKYSCYSHLTIIVEDNIAKVRNCDIQLSRQVNENQLIGLNLSIFAPLSITNFAYNSSTNKISGHITGKLKSNAYYILAGYQSGIQYDVNLEFETKVWETLR
jgi:hypothetical protein